jgi:PelA/Pel-15E family pectate lyase
LEAASLTGDEYFLDAARETAYALVAGQLQSGGWDYRIEFEPEARKKYAYRADGSSRSGRNVSTLDDDTTQAALRFLMHVDRALKFQDPRIHEAAQYGLASLEKAQYPNGAWPQRFSAPPDPAKFPVCRSSYPESWSREFPKKDYSTFYTFNDDTIADVVRTMAEAAHVYQDKRFLEPARKAGDFILLAQMPDPQPAWAQQYDADMHPQWARQFEPPAITGGESHGVMRILMFIYRETGDKKYLAPIPRAVEYLRKSQLPDGRLARFYELKTNRPLYFTKQYKLTYSSDDMPTHYAFIVGSGLDAVQREYEQLLKTPEPPPRDASGRERVVRMSASLANQAQSVIAALDERGAWVEEGRLRYFGEDDPARRVIDCQTFVRNVQTLSRFIAASR